MNGLRKRLRDIFGARDIAIASRLAPTMNRVIVANTCGWQLAGDVANPVCQEGCAKDSGLDQIHRLPRLIPAMAR